MRGLDIKIMVFKDMPLIRVGPMRLNFGGVQERPANLIPFKTILPYLLGEKGLLIAAINIGGNIALLVPIGFLIAFIFRNLTWIVLLSIAVASGLVIETTQMLLHVGIFDIDDVILNAFGVLLGFWAFTVLNDWLNAGKYKNIIISAITCIVLAAVALYTIYPKEQPNRFGKVNIAQANDPCNGTGGTGQIISVGNNTITIKRRDDENQVVKLTNQTKIGTSMGPATVSELKSGDRVTLIIDDSETASMDLVCKSQNP